MAEIEYLQVKSLEKYQHYKERNMIWFKWYVDALQDYKFSKLTDSQKWIFIGLICLACKCDNKIPNDHDWIIKQISNSKNISKDIAILVELDLLAIRYQDAMPRRCIEEEIIEEEKRDIYADFEKSALANWNSFCDRFPVLSKVTEISGDRRARLKKRFEKESFRQFDKILAALETQPFCRGENDRGWKVSFDWLIKNDTNYLKVLEMKYQSVDKKAIKDAEFMKKLEALNVKSA